jgi:hypothetical protein
MSILSIPDLENNMQIAEMVSEIKHRLRSGKPTGEWSELRSSLDKHLTNFIEENDLGSDQHQFVDYDAIEEADE